MGTPPQKKMRSNTCTLYYLIMSLGVERSEAGNKFQLILTKHVKECFLNIVVQRVILNIFRKKGKNLKDIEI